MIRMTYEPSQGVAYIYLVDRAVRPKPARGVWALDGNLLIDLDEQGRILGIEVLDTRAVLRDETLEGAESHHEPQPLLEQTLPKAA